MKFLRSCVIIVVLMMLSACVKTIGDVSESLESLVSDAFNAVDGVLMDAMVGTESEQRETVRKLLAEKDREDEELLSQLYSEIKYFSTKEELMFKKNFSVQEKLSPNVDWLTYDIVNEAGHVQSYGHALFFRKAFSNTLSDMRAGSNIIWIGQTLTLSGRKSLLSDLTTISPVITYGASEEVVISGLNKKFNVKSEDLARSNNCKEITAAAAFPGSYSQSIAILPFPFLKKSYEWAGADFANAVKARHPKLAKLQECFIHITGSSGGVSVDVRFIQNYGLIYAHIKNDHNKIINWTDFVSASRKRWGADSTHWKDGGSEYNGLMYSGFTVKRVTNNNKNKTTIEYRMSPSYARKASSPINHVVAYSDSYIQNMLGQNTSTSIPYFLLSAASELEEAIMSMYKDKIAKVADEVIL